MDSSNLNNSPSNEVSFRRTSAPSLPIADKLGREYFAISLAKVLSWQPHSTSMIVALCGEWGSGKSWVIQRIKLEWEKVPVAPGENRPVLIQFNPWQWSNGENLSTEFFKILSDNVTKIGTNEPSKSGFFNKLSKIGQFSLPAKQLRIYGAKLAVHSAAVDGYAKGVLGLSVLMALLCSADLLTEPDWFSVTMSALTAAVAFSAGLITFLSNIIAKVVESKKVETDENKKSLPDLKESLIASLKKLKRPILIVMDDLDRMTADEVAAVFQLVKAQADFPNIYYLLAFDRDIVEHSLERIAPGVPGNGLPAGYGRKFLEKIVEVSFELPKVTPILFREALYTDIRLLRGFSSMSVERFQDTWELGLKHYFKNLRDIDRFTNSLKFHSQLLIRENDELEVDGIDFVMVETLRLFEPTLHRIVAQNQSLLLSNTFRLSKVLRSLNADASDVESSRTSEALKELVKLASNREGSRQLLRLLFPQNEEILREVSDSPLPMMLTDAGSSPRAFEEAYFRRFFEFSISSSEWSQAELTTFMAKVDNTAEFTSYWRNILNGVVKPDSVLASPFPKTPVQMESEIAQRASDFADLFYRRVRNWGVMQSKEEIQVVKKLVVGLFDSGDILPDYWGGRSIARSIGDRLTDVIDTALRHVIDSSVREKIIVEALAETRGWALPVWFLWLESRRQEKGNGLSEKFLSPATFSMQKAKALALIESAAEDGRLWERPHSKLYLQIWRDYWGDVVSRQKLSRNLGILMSSEEGKLKFMQGFIGTMHTVLPKNGQDLLIREWTIDPSEIQEFVSTGRISPFLPQMRRSLEKELLEGRYETLTASQRRRWICIRLASYAFEQTEMGRSSMNGWSILERELDQELMGLFAQSKRE